MVPEIDLKPFCSSDRSRPYLHKPFSAHGFTWATNGHILVRVPQRADAPEQLTPNCQKIITQTNFEVPFRALGNLKLPKPKIQDCSRCEGRGVLHDCPDCQCFCDDCDGSGKVEARTTIFLRGGIFQCKYIRLLLSLPQIEMAETASGHSDSIPFKFTDGIGVLMGMNLSRDSVDIDGKDT